MFLPAMKFGSNTFDLEKEKSDRCRSTTCQERNDELPRFWLLENLEILGIQNLLVPIIKLIKRQILP
jgi:hypothetical protein